MSDIPPWEAARRSFPWIPWTIGGIITVIVGFTLLYVYVLAPSGNAIDKANQANQLQHEKRQSAIINQQNKNVYGSIGYQDGQIQIMEQRLSNIEGPAGLAVTRAGLPAGSGEQQVLQASEDSEISYFCEAGAKVAPDNPQFTSGHPSLAQLYAANCIAGAIRANPPLDRNPIPGGGI